MLYLTNSFEKNPTAHPNIIVVTITIGRPFGSNLYIKNAIGKTNAVQINPKTVAILAICGEPLFNLSYNANTITVRQIPLIIYMEKYQI
jgi:hypothetical protein